MKVEAAVWLNDSLQAIWGEIIESHQAQDSGVAFERRRDAIYVYSWHSSYYTYKTGHNLEISLWPDLQFNLLVLVSLVERNYPWLQKPIAKVAYNDKIDPERWRIDFRKFSDGRTLYHMQALLKRAHEIMSLLKEPLQYLEL